MKEKIIELYWQKPTWTASQIAQHLDTFPQSVHTTLRRAGLPLGARGRSRKLQDWERVAIAEAYRNGELLKNVAEEFNVTISAVTKIGRKAGYIRFPQKAYDVLRYKVVKSYAWRR